MSETNNKGPLSGIRVLDLTQALAGPFGAMLLGDLGADVIRVEAENTRPKVPKSRPHLMGESSIFLASNRNKRSIVLNLRTRRGKKVFYDLARVSDVVMDNFRPGVTERLGVDYETLSRINPLIISCSLSGFGGDGPYRDRPAYDLVVQAMSGGMSLTGEPPPVRSGLSIGDLTAGIWGAHGILAALFYRERFGVGQKVDGSLLEGQVMLLNTNVVEYYLAGKNPAPQWERYNPMYATYQTRDGHIVIAALLDKFFEGVCRALGREDLITDPRFSSLDKRDKNHRELSPIIAGILATGDSADWVEKLTAHDVPCSKVNKVADVVADPQVRHRGMIAEMACAEGALKVPASAVKFSAFQPQYRFPPALGEHTHEVLADLLGYDEDLLQKLTDDGVIRGPESSE